MTLFSALPLFLVMLTLAAIPSASVALVVTRSATHGIRNGVAVTAGIVLGDLVFVTLAVLGMGILAETVGSFFAVLKYLGGAYLIWMGIGLMRFKRGDLSLSTNIRASTYLASFFAGLLLTLGDVKAILFYASLLPAFVNMAHLTFVDISVIAGITVLTVGGVKIIYAFAAHKIVSRLQADRNPKHVRTAAGGVLVCAGSYLIVKA